MTFLRVAAEMKDRAELDRWGGRGEHYFFLDCGSSVSAWRQIGGGGVTIEERGVACWWLKTPGLSWQTHG